MKRGEAPPSRPVHRHGLQKKYNLVGGPKLDGARQTEVVLESNTAVAGQIDPRVARIQPQPVTFDLNTGRCYSRRTDLVSGNRAGGYKPWVYTPDFQFTLTDRSLVFIECKHTYWLRKNPEWLRVPKAMRRLGHRFVLVTDKLFSEALVRNLRVLLTTPPDTNLTNVRNATGNLIGAVSAEALMATHNITKAQIFAGLLAGILTTDLSALPLGPKTSISPANGDKSHLEVLPLWPC